MSFNLNTVLIENVRLGTGNNPFTFSPRIIILDNSEFQSSYPRRVEYCVLAESLLNSTTEIEIGDPNLIFKWTKNESTAVRFDYDGFRGKWLPLPGSPPEELGPISNEPRLIVQAPDLDLIDSPFDIYVGNPTRIFTFVVQMVGDPLGFLNPGAVTIGTVQVSQNNGELNFSSTDLGRFAGQTVINIRQGFFSRTNTTGIIGTLPSSSSEAVNIFLNPKPGTGQFPRVRIDFRNYLTPIEVPTETSFGSPTSGTFQWSLDTGKIKFSNSDINSFSDTSVYYDGVFNGSFQLTKTNLGLPSNSSPTFNVPAFIGLTDPLRYIFFAQKSGQPRSYFKTVLVEEDSNPRSGTVNINTIDGDVFFRSSDVTTFSDYDFIYVDTYGVVENGVGVQFFRSGANSSAESAVGDFSVRYFVEDQLLSDSLMQTDTFFLPTVPIVDANLEYTIEQGTQGGNFTGDLKNNSNPTEIGIGYLRNFDKKQLIFSERKEVDFTLEASSSIIKIQDSVISPINFNVEIDGETAIPGVDFDFDQNSGLIEFTDPIGLNDPNDVLNIAGISTLPNKFNSTLNSFNNASFGKYLLIKSGSNAGIYLTTLVSSESEVFVSPNFQVSQSDTADLISQAEIVADRFFTDVFPPLKKLKIEKSDTGISGIFQQVNNSEFGFAPTIGQINLRNPTNPGQVFRITYVYLQSDDEGVTTNPTTIVEFASFPIRQESAVVTPGSRIVSFNSPNRTISSAIAQTFYLNGVTLASDLVDIKSSQTAEIAGLTDGDVVTTTYFVSEALGGELSFTLSSTPIDVDTPSISVGQTQIVLNGDQTSVVSSGSPVLIDSETLFIANEATYSSADDTTTIKFSTSSPATFTNPNIQIANSISELLVIESISIIVIPANTRSFSFTGSISILPNSIIVLDDDPYLVIAVEYKGETNKTTITTAAAARKNYLSPSFQRTIRPVYQPGKNFQTLNFAKINPDPTLILMGGENQGILIKNVDYDISEGGSISLQSDIGFGESLFALYVSRISKPKGTEFQLNYANSIASSRLFGQKLLTTYNLYSPDSFFFNVETSESYIPEVQSFLRQNAQSSGVSGPNTGDALSLATKNQGSPGLYYDELHFANLDSVVVLLLRTFNVIVNGYEDILSNLDGRVVGGLNGKFKFDGNKSNPIRDSINDVTNEIDDRILVRYSIKLTDLSPLTIEQIPIYKRMWEDSDFSRIFPTSKIVTAGLGDNVNPENFGETIGSLNVENIKSSGTMTSSNARLIFTEVEGKNTLVIETPNGESVNGDTENGIPPFVVGKEIQILSYDGIVSLNSTIDTIETVDDKLKIKISGQTDLLRGTVFHKTSDSNDLDNHFYTVGRDIGVENDDGQIINITVSLPAPFDFSQIPIVGSELVDVKVKFSRSETFPFRFPALDGSEFGDNGRYSEPLVRRDNELDILQIELDLIESNIITAVVAANGLDVILSIVTKIGDTIRWSDGPNSGLERTIVSISPGVARVNSALTPDPDGSSLVLIDPLSENIDTIIEIEKQILSTNISFPPTGGALIGTINSELTSVDLIIQCFGDVILTGTGTTSAGTLTDTGVDFVLAGATEGSLVWVTSGSNHGLYSVTVATATALTINTSDPFADFPVFGSTQYTIIEPFSFLSTDQFGVVSEFLRKTLQFYDDTVLWQNSMTVPGKSTRTTGIVNRRTDDSNFIEDIEDVLINGELYENRYLWIQTRTDKETGTLRLQFRAAGDIIKNTRTLVENQRKLLISQGLS